MTTTINASTSGSGGLVQTADASGVLALQTAGTTAVTIDASQNVGIGMTPTNFGNGYTVLQVANASNGGMLYLTNTANAGGRIYGNGAGITYDAFSTTYHAFNTNSSERMRIDSSGQVLVGITSAIIGSRTLQVKAPSGGSASAFQVANNGNAGCEFFNASGSKVGDIAVNVSTTAYNTSSDYRLKEAIAPMTGALAKVAALKPVTYKWKLDGSDGQGFIAHELDEVVPGCVTGEKDAVDEDGNPKYQGIDVSFLVATLTAAIQELTARIAALEA